jgi:hypothetical protein
MRKRKHQKRENSAEIGESESVRQIENNGQLAKRHARPPAASLDGLSPRLATPLSWALAVGFPRHLELHRLLDPRRILAQVAAPNKKINTA